MIKKILQLTKNLTGTASLMIALLYTLSLHAALDPLGYDEYREFCLQAATDDTIFQTFKTNPSYRGILEHVTPSMGYEYLQFIQIHYPYLLEEFDQFHENDSLGSPFVCHYPKTGKTSPSTLRYIKVLGDLEKYFGNLDQKHIIEIGGGYGGQCLIISKRHSFKEYQIIDLPEAAALAQKYLNFFDVLNAHCLDCTKTLPSNNYDLVISNYGFAEFSRPIQQFYLNKIIKNAKHGYLTLNTVDVAASTGTFTLDELIEELKAYGFNPQVFNEQPTARQGSLILIW